MLVAFVALIAALGALWGAGREGDLVGKAVEASSHGSGQGVVGLLEDVLGF